MLDWLVGVMERARLGDPATRRDALRRAHRLFTALGITARAEQVARDLG